MAIKLPDLTGIKYVFLDRDGVINQKVPEGHYITRWEEVKLISGVVEAIRALNTSNRTVIVITNQRGIALGLLDEAGLLAIHQRLRETLGENGARLDAVYFCPHDVNECNCRKPAKGMVESAFRDFPGASSSNSLLIGDSLSDIQLACRMGMRCICIMGEPHIRKNGCEQAGELANAVAESLAEAVGFLPA